MAKLCLSSPWNIYYNKINAFFMRDPEVNVIFDEENYNIKIYVSNGRKAAALSKILIPQQEFGNITLDIEVIPPNGILKNTANTDLVDAFAGNGALFSIEKVEGFGFNAVYVIFQKEVVQYFTDDLGSYYGKASTLYEDIAREIFDVDTGIFFCTSEIYIVGNGCCK